MGIQVFGSLGHPHLVDWSAQKRQILRNLSLLGNNRGHPVCDPSGPSFASILLLASIPLKVLSFATFLRESVSRQRRRIPREPLCVNLGRTVGCLRSPSLGWRETSLARRDPNSGARSPLLHEPPISPIFAVDPRRPADPLALPPRRSRQLDAHTEELLFS
jgi:hypothetical protein